MLKICEGPTLRLAIYIYIYIYPKGAQVIYMAVSHLLLCPEKTLVKILKGTQVINI